MAVAVAMRSVGRAYRRFGSDRPWTWQDALVRGWRSLKPAETFWALRDVTFDIRRGRMVGIIGRNGAGKSTLLRLIGGVGRPNTGQIEVHGRIGALLELGAGFHPDLTGRENIEVNGVINGLTRAETAMQFEAIVRFAELEAFVENPLRTYSSGMVMRLAFAIAAHVQPDLLLIDEVLSVGDIAFQKKCLERIGEFRSSGCTILLVSHNTDQISALCDEALWLEAGRLAAHGPACEVVDRYMAALSAHPSLHPDHGPTARSV
jgi:lipopolysaccharide transport system ATP-binding protein